MKVNPTSPRDGKQSDALAEIKRKNQKSSFPSVASDPQIRRQHLADAGTSFEGFQHRESGTDIELAQAVGLRVARRAA